MVFQLFIFEIQIGLVLVGVLGFKKYHYFKIKQNY